MTVQSSGLQPGSHIGDLQINAILGVGATGITYMVTDPAIGTRFALKEYLPAKLVTRGEDGKVIPNDPAASPAFAQGLKLFLHEARIVAALDHPNIVKVLRYFEANGTAYFLMPYYKGQALHQLIESHGAFNREEAKSLMLPLMDALEYMHKAGVVHQDIKPGNIYMMEQGDPVLLDFGVAAASGKTPRLGSEGYAAPEQSDADDPIGPWTDIYGLSATLYRCVTGKIPTPAVIRQEALSIGETDPLTAFSELAPTGLYGGLTDAVDLGLKVPWFERPRDVGIWKKSFKSLDWHRSVVVAGKTDAYAKEGREWLPMILLGVFLLTMTAVGIYLLTGESPQPTTTAGTPGPDESSPSVAPTERAREPSSQELERWQGALKADTVLGYRRFISDFPESIYRDQAETQLDILDENSWKTLSAEDRVPAYEDYLEVFPDGIHQAEALQRIEAIQQAEAKKERERLERERLDNLAWENANSERTVKSFDRYISEWPAGLHIEEATRIRRLLKDQSEDDMAFQTALKLNNKEAFQAYIDAFPKGVNIASALQHIDDLTLRPGKTFKDCSDCPTMMVIPSAAFWQGSAEDSPLALGMEKPRRLVTIGKPFAVSVYEITMAEWDRCFNDKGCTAQPGDNGWGRGSRPVIMVSWNDAEEYVHWLSEKTGQSYRLPSESEWEYVARAGQESDWPGGHPAIVCEYGNVAGAETGFKWQHEQCRDQTALGTTPVGTFRANAFGLYDTIGNVSEWTADCMNLSYVDAPVDGSAWGRGICSSHITRGGSWITGSKEIRLPARFNLKNGDRNDFTGFRVAREINE
ncbi:MAG: bifunctional serine/threonine-protein kinase/formylglycine-generating enzyme family protein [Lysobacterales bacterium]